MFENERSTGTKDVLRKRKVTWGITGSGHRLTETVEIMKNKFEMRVIEPPLLIKYTPDQNGLEQCKVFGKKVAASLPSYGKQTQFHDRRPFIM
jgi:flavorubredoxin